MDIVFDRTPSIRTAAILAGHYGRNSQRVSEKLATPTATTAATREHERQLEWTEWRGQTEFAQQTNGATFHTAKIPCPIANGHSHQTIRVPQVHQQSAQPQCTTVSGPPHSRSTGTTRPTTNTTTTW